MKHLLTGVLGLLCLGLAVFLFVSKRNSDAQHQQDAEAIASATNRLSSSQLEVAGFIGKVFILSNQLQTCRSTSLTLSNELVEAKSALSSAKEGLDRQIRDLQRQITQKSTQWETEEQASSQRIADLTHRITELTNHNASVQASLDQADKNYVLLENRFRRDVAERVMVERKFNNSAELKAQMEYLHWNPSREITEDRIREGLNVVVGKSNLCYVIAPE
jgi:chromosome segregation ATPase